MKKTEIGGKVLKDDWVIIWDEVLDTCLFQFELSVLEVNGRLHGVVRVLAFRVVEQLDVFEHVASSVFAGSVGSPADLFPFQQLKEALGHSLSKCRAS